ncbi:hypothetical protein Brms1b_003481 [Colletotrichum noveboracense]|nr:hypothetical protein COL940_009662 [Colletotrichum noveboracense]KAJ0319889.1 hypothetical protein Brms1b_003481 [Colletotrichum noveboracense]
MGIRAEDIERNLERVLTLDEADIFLEKRTTESLKRNALISVFLRILEYYNGKDLTLAGMTTEDAED